MIIFSLTLIK